MGSSGSKRKKKEVDKSTLSFTRTPSNASTASNFSVSANYLTPYSKLSVKEVLSNEETSGLFGFIDDRRNSLPDIDRIDSYHYVTRKLWNGDFKAPVEDVLKAGNARVLDVGTGKGTWIMQCAEQFPWSNFIGVDICLNFPTITNIKLTNATFLQLNVLNKLPFDDNTFDFVHMRCLILDFTGKEWEDKVLNELARVCKPGGWIELVESDCAFLNEGPTFSKVNEAVREYLIDRNMKPILGDDLAIYLRQTEQITDIVEEIKHPPYYGSKLGKAFRGQLIECLRTFEVILTSYMGYSNEEWNEVVETIKKEIVTYKTKGMMRRVYGKKIGQE